MSENRNRSVGLEDAQVHFQANNTILAWLASAERVLRAADILLNVSDDARFDYAEDQTVESLVDSEMDRCASMLFGLAIENVAKAALLRQGKCRFNQKGKLIWSSGSGNANGHELSQLVTAIGVNLNNRETLLLKCLESFVVWAGRYPIPLTADKMFIVQAITPEGLPPLPVTADEAAVCRRLFSDLKEVAWPARERGRAMRIPGANQPQSRAV